MARFLSNVVSVIDFEPPLRQYRQFKGKGDMFEAAWNAEET